jgi:2-dehydro-3-deoxyphosphogluconate aldolase / (4S)-4-hydroxy-2-oxoglutarate aldolase
MMDYAVAQSNVAAILNQAPVVPVMVIEDVKHAVPLAKALVAGGLPVLEITLRTDAALESMKAIMAEVEGAIVGAGTVLTPAQFKQCSKLGLCCIAGLDGKALGCCRRF